MCANACSMRSRLPSLSPFTTVTTSAGLTVTTSSGRAGCHGGGRGHEEGRETGREPLVKRVKAL